MGVVAGLTGLSLALASVPHNANQSISGVGDTAITQELSEIRVQKEAAPNFDSDIQRLSQLETRYHETLPKPIKHVSKRNYKPAKPGVTPAKSY
jgi:hypothetical protein